MAAQDDVFAAPQVVDDIDRCNFYHVMEIPGHGLVEGEWDLRGHEAEYLGRVPFAGKRVLEVGPASGFLTFFMEAQGADVVCLDLSADHDIELVPYADIDWRAHQADLRPHMDSFNKAWWYAHRVLGSRARMAHGTVYAIPPALGRFDVGTLNAVLLHLRDPFLALQNTAAVVSETLIVTDLDLTTPLRRVLRRAMGPHLTFLPDAATGSPKNGFWALNPDVIRRMMAVLGFGRTEVTTHRQHYAMEHRDMRTFTVVGHRTVPLAVG